MAHEVRVTREDVSFSWEIDNVGYKIIGIEEKWVDKISWRCEGKVEIDGQIYSSLRQGILKEQQFKDPLPGQRVFVNYDDLTEEICFSWMFSPIFTRNSIENDICSSINDQLYDEHKSVPWKK